MSKLKKLESPEIWCFNGYLEAAQHAFIKGELEVSLEAEFFEIVEPPINDEDVLVAAYSSFNPIEYRRECSLEEMMAGISETLSMPRWMWKSHPGIPKIMERNLREGYWKHLNASFNCKNARIVELGHDVPCVNMDGGFTFILYAEDMSRCVILVGNVSD
jgi:hypothetical protein